MQSPDIPEKIEQIAAHIKALRTGVVTLTRRKTWETMMDVLAASKSVLYLTDEMRESLTEKMKRASCMDTSLCNLLGHKHPEYGLSAPQIRGWRKGPTKRVVPEHWKAANGVLDSLIEANL